MSKEIEIYNKIVAQLGGAVDFQRHEDKYSRGIPDVSYGVNLTNGWIELKRIAKEPKNPHNVIIIRHFTGQQKNWLEKRQKCGGNCWLLLQIGDKYYLFKGDKVERVGISYDFHDITENAHSICDDGSKVGKWLFKIIGWNNDKKI